MFIEIGTDKNHVHFPIRSVPMYSPKKIAQLVKSITAREIFKKCPFVKKELWGGEFWSDGYFITSVGQDGNESIIKDYLITHI
jgi:putative transposase